MSELKPLRIDTGRVTIPVVDPHGDRGELSFNPRDAKWQEDFAAVTREILEKYEDISQRVAEIEKQYPLDQPPSSEGGGAGDPAFGAALSRAEAESGLVAEFCAFCETRLDRLFGEDACKKVFGGDRVPEAYPALLEALTPYIQQSRERVLEKYKKQPQPKKK